jgi:hypothetical protein
MVVFLKKIFLSITTLLMLNTNLFAKHSIQYMGITLGEVHNFDSLKENYIEAKVTNSIAKMILNKEKVVLYNEKYNKSKRDKKTKYKKERSSLIDLLKSVYKGTVKEGEIIVNSKKKILLKKENNKFMYEFIRVGKEKKTGFFIVENNELIELVENEDNIRIIKIN